MEENASVIIWSSGVRLSDSISRSVEEDRRVVVVVVEVVVAILAAAARLCTTAVVCGGAHADATPT